MNTDHHPDSKIIDTLGGTAKVARLCGISQPSVSNWRLHGISRAWRAFLMSERPDAFPDAPKRPKRRRSAAEARAEA